MPTDEELDALVAYQLALGRQEDFNLPSLELRSPFASSGKTLYLDSGKPVRARPQELQRVSLQRRWHGGHVVQPPDAGIPGHRRQSARLQRGGATNVNDTPLALALGLPRDGGFGQLLTVFGSFGNTDDLPRRRPLGARGVQQPASCGVGGHGPLLPQPHGDGPGVGGGVLRNAGVPDSVSGRTRRR